jgi:hypothetical protein
MNLTEANEKLDQGLNVRLPEWRGYWFKNKEGLIRALTKDGEIKDALVSAYMDRLDWEIAEGLDFGWAICALKAGKLVARKGWNGKGMFLFQRPDDELELGFIIDKVKSLPQSVKDFFKTKDEKEAPSEQGLTKVKFTSYLCMYAANGSIVNGWLASQTDILTQDWQLFQDEI